MNGEHDAFSELAARVRPRLHRVAYRILRDEDLADEAVQDALISAWCGLHRLRERSRLDAWLHRVTVRAAYHVVRVERRRVRQEEEFADADVRSSAGDEEQLVALRDQIHRAFLRLTPRERAALVLRYRFDLPLSEAAAVLDIPVGTMKSRLSHARNALRAVLDADERAELAS